MPYLSASAVVFHNEEALYQVHGPFTFLVGYVTVTLMSFDKQSNGRRMEEES